MYMIYENFLSFSGLSFDFFSDYPLQHKSFNINEVQSLIFSFISHIFGAISKQPLSKPKFQGFMIIFSSNNFIVLCCTFIDFYVELIFV
jgi:hypothetical protein